MHFAEIAGAFVGSARPTTSRLVPPSSGRDERLGRDRHSPTDRTRDYARQAGGHRRQMRAFR
jgi:hypothetical protein